MKRLALLVVLALGGLLALAGPAAAHVSVSSADAAPGGYAVVSFRVPTESDTASTVKVVVQVPPVGSVAVQPVPGWTVTTKTAKLARPLKTDDGEVTEAVSEITWAAAGPGIKPGEFQQFDVSMGPLPDKPSITFKAIQYYSDGTSSKWIETPAPGSSAEPEHPAPTLKLAAATMTAAAAPHVVRETASTTGPTVLSVVALVVACGALGLAFVSRARSTP